MLRSERHYGLGTCKVLDMLQNPNNNEGKGGERLSVQ
jgi:hypothetical protein